MKAYLTDVCTQVKCVRVALEQLHSDIIWERFVLFWSKKGIKYITLQANKAKLVYIPEL